MVQMIIAPKGAVDVEPSTRGKPSSEREGSSTGIEVTRGSDECEHVLNKGANVRKMITVINVDRDLICLTSGMTIAILAVGDEISFPRLNPNNPSNESYTKFLSVIQHGRWKYGTVR